MLISRVSSVDRAVEKRPFFSCQIGMNAGANRLCDNIGTAEAVFLEDIDVCLDFDVIRSVFSSRVICNSVNKIA